MSVELDIDHVLKLASLEVEAEEKRKLRTELQSILDYFSMLDEVDTSQVDTTYIHPHLSNQRLRSDEPEKFRSVDLIKELFPNKEDAHLKIPPILSKGHREQV